MLPERLRADGVGEKHYYGDSAVAKQLVDGADPSRNPLGQVHCVLEPQHQAEGPSPRAFPLRESAAVVGVATKKRCDAVTEGLVVTFGLVRSLDQQC